MPLKRIILAVGLGLTLAGSAAAAEDTPPVLPVLKADELTLEEFQWINRLVVVFADTPADPRFAEQMRMLLERPFDLIERDVVVITDTDPSARSPLRMKLRPRGFMMVLIGKDGGIKLRKPSPWSTREISRSIDKFPMRQEEIREKKEAARAG